MSDLDAGAVLRRWFVVAGFVDSRAFLLVTATATIVRAAACAQVTSK